VGMSRNKLIPLPMCNKHFPGPSEDVMDGQVVKVRKEGNYEGITNRERGTKVQGI
jgi:hypothetical protein